MRTLHPWKWVFLALALVSVALLGGCDDSDDNGGGGTPVGNSLVGEWTPVSATQNGAAVTLGAALDWDATVVRQTLDLNDNGTFSLFTTTADGNTTEQTGTYTRTATTLTLNFADSTQEVFAYTVNGNVVTLTQADNGTTTAVVFVKQIAATQQDPALAQTWVQTNVEVLAGPDVQVPADTITAQLLPSGSIIIRPLQLLGNNLGGFVMNSIVGTWAASNGAISIGFTEGLPPAYGTYVLQGNTLVLTLFGNEDPMNPSTVRYTWTKWGLDGQHIEALQGTWNVTNVTVGGVAVPVGNFFGWEPDAAATQFVFFADGTLLSRNVTNTGTAISGLLGKWNTSDPNNITLVLNALTEGTYAVDGNTATITFDLNGEQAVLTMQR